jgi:hypothetical protein
MVFLVLLIPIGVLAFALLMERLELRLRTGSVSEQDVEEFFDHAQPDEVTTFVQEGWTRALSRFRDRSRSNRPSRRSRFSRWASSLGGSGSAESPADASSSGPTTGVAEPQGGVMPGDKAPGSAQSNGDMKQ